MRHTAVITLLACAVAAHAASYTTYIGDQYSYQVAGIATDSNGNTYITGSRVISASASGVPVTDVFVSKLDPSGNLTPIATFSGKGSDQANGIAVDSSGNIYIVGNTTSPDFPLLNPLQRVCYTSGMGSVNGTGFLMKLGPDGAVLYSTYLGGTQGASFLSAVAVDAEGNAYVTGWTTATDYPHTTGLPAGLVSGTPVDTIYGAFFAKIGPAGSRIVYAGALSAAPSCLAGCVGINVLTQGISIAVDPAGNAYIGGNTYGQMSGTPGALLVNGIGAFIVKVNAAGSGLAYLTFLSVGKFEPLQTLSLDGLWAIAADAEGNAYITGYMSDPAFPVTPSAYQTKLGAQQANAFVAKLNPTGSAMVWATLLGGTGPDNAQTIATDPAGNVWVSGTTQSANFPTTVSVTSGGEFLAELNSTGAKLSYSARFPTNTVATALAVDSFGTVHAAGANGLVSALTPGSAPGLASAPWIFGIANAARGDLSGRLAPGELISIYGLHLGPATPVSATFNAAGFLPVTLSGVRVTIGGTAAPMLYVSPTQINLVAPVELTAGAAADLQLTVNGAAVADFRSMPDIAAPQVFLGANGAAAINQNGTVNSASNPAPDGSYVSVWATGTGYFPGSDGQIQTAADQFCGSAGVCQVLAQSAPFTSTPVVVSYIGAAPGLVNGVVQVNFQVTGGADTYYFSVNGINSYLFGISVAQ